MSEFYNKLKEVAPDLEVKEGELLKNHTTFKIGGPADYFVTPTKIEELSNIIKLCLKEGVPYYILGNGSNLLVSDKGYRGVIIQIYKTFNQVVFEEKDNHFYVTAGSGILLSEFAAKIMEHSLTGFEFASGIPGTLGGAVTMNAGAYGGEMKHCIKEATLLSYDGDICKLNKEQLNLGYRTSIIQEEKYIVVDATFEFTRGNKEEIINKMKDLNRQRKEKQPLEYPSAGSTFKRPEGYFAGKLIMDADLRGYRVGDIMVSEKHCGFVINVGNGTAKDVRTLISDVDRIVYEKFGVHLEPEVRMLGEFD
ncbi:UDP-N-acetylenolpyruvoylglucosamine reductase [Anaeromicropila herbilytica]|uniref:UDP-N-acetylenolpyruvoylglucosamine reductase n=1 Tax=Anaeromicropila herbilytica TaxID=2785025 RepID=A0A7R7EPE2_9FIRM|nr:UDP-N-acetylenolpyruvoylglucosamine reductase [Anaeromicropila herbilytica]